MILDLHNNKFPLISPPSDDSLQTKYELLYLESLGNTQFPHPHYRSDSWTRNNFDETLIELNIDPEWMYCREIEKYFLSTLHPIMRNIKSYFDRKRPHQLSSKIEPAGFEIPDANFRLTSSYPSGHATHVYYLAETHSIKKPKHRETLYKKAEEMLADRIKLKNHFVSDYEYGKLLGIIFAKEFCETL